MMAGQLRTAGLDWSTLCYERNTLAVQIPYRQIDSDHLRSCVKTMKRCFEALSERIAAEDPDSQTAEVHICIALMM